MTKVEITEDGMIYLPATGTRLSLAQAKELHENLQEVIEKTDPDTRGIVNDEAK